MQATLTREQIAAIAALCEEYDDAEDVLITMGNGRSDAIVALTSDSGDNIATFSIGTLGEVDQDS